MKNLNYLITCLTNLHMGSGDVNFNIVDNEVQRDPITKWPEMYASGIKGALRDHCFKLDEGAVEDIFGSDIIASRSGSREGSKPGKLRFLSGKILFLPIRAAKGRTPYFLVTTRSLLEAWAGLYQKLNGSEFVDGLMAAIAGLKTEETYAGNTAVDIRIENSDYKADALHPIEGSLQSALAKLLPETDLDRVLILKEEDEVVKNCHLPVTARNQLDNGISKNLWYEEVVPHEALFYFFVLSDGTEEGDDALDIFGELIDENPLVQFGGNATIGRGLTELRAYGKEG